MSRSPQLLHFKFKKKSTIFQPPEYLFFAIPAKTQKSTNTASILAFLMNYAVAFQEDSPVDHIASFLMYNHYSFTKFAATVGSRTHVILLYFNHLSPTPGHPFLTQH
jgi:hypothetical protein